MFIALKIIHILCIFVGGGASIGNAVLMKRVTASGNPPPPLVADAMGVLARMGLAAVILLWLTGLPLVFLIHGSLAVGLVFYLKLISASVVLASVSLINLERAHARTQGRTPKAAKMKILAKVSQLSTVVAIACAVIAFN